jgi:YYY domain-containing protein
MIDARKSSSPLTDPMLDSTSTGGRLLVGLLLILVMAVGGYFRFVGLNWDDFTHLHPDERFLTGVVASLGGGLSFTDSDPAERQLHFERCMAAYPDSNGQGGFFDADCSPYNPHNVGSGLYVYGTLPLFIVKGASEMVVNITGDSTWSSYEGVHLVWRALSALSEMGVILIIFLIGTQLHGKYVGLLASVLYAAAVFPIQQAHFGTVDAMSNLFIILTIWFALQVQKNGQIVDYLGFGLAFAAALAGRINTVPLVGLLLLAAIVQTLPIFDDSLAWSERERLVVRNFIGLLLAGIVTIVGFRLFQPYAFMGPGIITTSLNPRWLADMGTAQHLVSGLAESPPNWQWTGRTPYLFPLSNMVLWGMGVALGIAGWAAWGWAGYRLLRGRTSATKNLLLVVWVLVYFGWLGRQWVMTMRYYLPLYPVLALLAAWALVELLRRANRPTAAAWQRLAAGGLLIGVVGFTYLWAGMFTNIYRHQLTRVQASNWVWENVPGDFSMTVEGADVPLINIAVANRFGLGGENDLLAQTSRYEDGQVITSGFVAPASGMISTVHAPHLGDPVDDAEPEALRVTITLEDGMTVLGQGTLDTNFSRESHTLGDAYDITLDDPVEVEQGQRYFFQVEALSGGPFTSAGAIISHEGAWDDGVPWKVCALPPGITLASDPPPGLVSATDCQGRDAWGALVNGYQMYISYEDVEQKRDIMVQALDDSEYLSISSNRFYDSESRIPERWPMTMRYYDALFSGELGFELIATFQETFELGPLRVSDQYLPMFTGPEWLNEFEAEEAFHVYDHPVVFIFRKTDAHSTETMREILYGVPLEKPEIAIGSFNDPAIVGVVPLYSLPASAAPTQLQLPEDMRETQYDNGTWSSRFDSDSIVNTQPVLTVAIWWLTMMVFGWAVWPLLFALFPALEDRGYGFAKLAGLLLTAWIAWFVSSARIPLWSQQGVVIALLGVVVLSAIMGWRSRAALGVYVQQYWRRLLGIEAITLLAFLGFLAVRLGNPDLWHPSFGGEKPMDFAYFNGILRSTVFPPIDPWYAGGYLNYYYFGFVVVGTPVLLLGVIPSIAYNLILPTLFALTGIGAFSVAFNVVSTWQERKSRQTILTVEGSEVRKRHTGTAWLAGVSALILAVVVGNLDTPRVFLNAVADTGYYQNPPALQTYLVEQYTLTQGSAPDEQALSEIIRQSQDEAGSFPMSIARGFEMLFNGRQLNISTNRWYWAPTRILAETPGVEGNAINEMPFFTFLYGDLHAHMINMPVLLLIMSFLFNELILAGRDGRPRLERVLGLAFGALVVGLVRAINTWDYPSFMLFSLIALFYIWWLRTPQRSGDQNQRALWVISAVLIALGVGGVLVRLFRQSSASDPGSPESAGFLLTMVAVMFIGLWTVWSRASRRSILNLALYVGGFLVLSIVLTLPYITWYAATYNSIGPWEGGKTPLWAYLDIHGLFLVLILSLLVWDTARWFRSVYLYSLRGMWPILVILFLAGVLTLLGVVVLAAASYQVALIVIPMIIWIAVLFFRSGQSRPMQFILVLAGLGLALTLGVEFVVVGGDIGRQNTVFKFYIQAWLLFSVAGGAAFAWLIQSSARWSSVLRGGWFALTSLLIVIAALYPLMASRAKAVDRMASGVPFTLDGMTYMQYASLYEGDLAVLESNPEAAPFPLVDDYHMIRWMQENIEGTPVIMEGQSDREYRWESRVSIYTGFPAVIGWNWHQRQQRTFDPMPRLVQQRVANVNAFYSTTDIVAAWEILQHYDVSYIVVSNLERAYYMPEGLAKFNQMVELDLLEVVYEEGPAIIYRVDKDAVLREVG